MSLCNRHLFSLKHKRAFEEELVGVGLGIDSAVRGIAVLSDIERCHVVHDGELDGARLRGENAGRVGSRDRGEQCCVRHCRVAALGLGDDFNALRPYIEEMAALMPT
jgi:hypothetical protein